MGLKPWGSEWADRIRGILGSIRRESLSIGVKPIDPEDGLILYSIVALKASGNSAGVFRVLDLGAGIGYSTLWMAYALEYSCRSECILVAIERYKDRASMLRRNLESQGFSMVQVEVVEADALEYLESLPAGSVDVAFVDISKSSYSRALALLEDRVKPGGVVLVHNAYYPSTPPGLFERLEEGPWEYTVAPTPQGLVIATRSP